MNRRQLLGGVGTVGVSAGGLWLAYELSQGNISLGETAAVSETVSRTSETFAFEAADGQEISVTVTDTGEQPYSGAFALYDPSGEEVLDGGPGATDMVNEVHTATSSGTYELAVSAQRTKLRVTVAVRDAGE
jgi:hypothetical protein